LNVITLLSTISGFYNTSFLFTELSEKYGIWELRLILGVMLVRAISAVFALVRFARIYKHESKSAVTFFAGIMRANRYPSLAIDVANLLTIVANIRILGAMKGQGLFDDYKTVVTLSPQSYVVSLYVSLILAVILVLTNRLVDFVLNLYTYFSRNLEGQAIISNWTFFLNVLLCISAMRLSYDYRSYETQKRGEYYEYYVFATIIFVLSFFFNDILPSHVKTEPRWKLWCGPPFILFTFLQCIGGSIMFVTTIGSNIYTIYAMARHCFIITAWLTLPFNFHMYFNYYGWNC